MQTISKYRFLVHIGCWVIFLIVPFLSSPIHDYNSILSNRSNLMFLLVKDLIWIALFYVNLLYFTPVLLKKNGVTVFLTVVVVTMVIVSFADSMLRQPFGPPPNFHSGPPVGAFRDPRRQPPLDFRGPFFSNFLVSFAIMSLGTIIVLWSDWVKTKAEEQERAFQRVASELAVLKLQISPHFLFNTLNNIRWLIRSKSEHAEAAVVKLSQLLRYILYKAQTEKVPLEDEVAHLKDYIDLQRMRLADAQAIEFVCQGNLQHKTIVPLLFIPIVENVFKHADFAHGFTSLIELKFDEYLITLTTRNRMKEASERQILEESGIGLANVKRRLELHFPGRHALKSSTSDGIFTVDLQIIFSR